MTHLAHLRRALCACAVSSVVVPTAGWIRAQEPGQGEPKREAHFDDSKFTSLFDGQTLAGWVTKGGRYDGKAVWTVEDGAITGREGPGHAGGLIYTERRYASFIFTCDTRISYPFDSGIFLRMVPRDGGKGGKGAQVTLDYRPSGEIAGIYADGWLQHNQEAKAKFRRDAWNHVEVRCTGRDMRIQTWLNGELVTNFAMPKDTAGYAPRGLIGLQVHGSRNDPEGAKAQFKNVRIRELPEFDPTAFEADDRGFLALTEAGAKAGWQKLFNGKDLSGWEGVRSNEGYRARDGVLELLVKGRSPHIITSADFEDFDLRLDFKIAQMANSGLFLRAERGAGNPAYSGCEIQILDDFNWEKVTKSKLKPWQFTGSLYGSVPAGKPTALSPLGVWNSLEVHYRGTQLRVVLNGKQLYDVDTTQVETSGAAAFAKRAARGFIGLQRHAPRQVEGDAYAWFRNIFVRPL